jgi:tRNA(Ile)-lysidine synthase
METWEKFKAFVSENRLIEPGDRVIAAVSGGPDSVCLTHLLWRLKKTLPLELVAVNMNHGLRQESSAEAKKVQALGKKLGIPVILKNIKVKETAGAEGVSLETAGRNLRYENLFSLAKQMGFNKIATGHTANDNAETMLMWLMRGTGTEGLAGIPMVRGGGNSSKIVRPILSATRREIMEYIKRQKLPYSIDSSNSTLDFTRNRIRHKVIPLLETFNPKLVEHVYNLSRIIGSENEILADITRRALKQLARVSKSGISLDLKGFFRYNETVRLRILKEILPERRSLKNIRCLYGLVLSSNRKEIILSKYWRVKKSKNRLVFQKTKSAGKL